MTATTFPVTPDVTAKDPHEKMDYVGKLRVALRRPIEATWLPREPLIACDDDHALLTAMCSSFYDHFPLRLSPDAIWIAGWRRSEGRVKRPMRREMKSLHRSGERLVG